MPNLRVAVPLPAQGRPLIGHAAVCPGIKRFYRRNFSVHWLSPPR